MNTDISYIARIDKVQKESAIKELEAFCVNTEDYRFDMGLITKDCLITFAINDEESTRWYKNQYECSQKVVGKTLVGSIQLWITGQDEYCDFEFWAVSSSIGQACADSKNLRGLLTAFVIGLNGQSLKYDDGSGYIETIFDIDNLT